MDPKLVDYILANRGRYTREAIRQRLIEAGHDPAEVDRAWVALTTPDRDATAGPGFWRRFWLYLIGANVAIFLLVGLLTGILATIGQGGVVVAVVFAIVLAIGALISWAIVAATRPSEMRRGTAVAIGATIPLVFAVLIGGGCYALIGASGMGGAPPATGSLELHIQEPSDFDGSGRAECFVQDGGWSMFGQIEGGPDGGFVTVSSEFFPGTNASLGPSLSITFESATEGPLVYSTAVGGGELSLDIARDGSSGIIQFDGLLPEFATVSGPFGGEVISGGVNWDCRDAG